MASFFSSTSSPFLSHPLTRTHHLSSSPQPPPPPTPPPPPPRQPLSSSSSQPPLPIAETKQRPASSSTKAESTDWIASTLTRRFGLGAGLAWAGFLAFGVVSEQIKTRIEVSQQEANTRDVDKEEEVVLPNGIRYYELKVGGGASPRVGDLVVIDIVGKVEESGEVFVNTFGEEQRPLALVVGSRPYSKGMCEGIEYVLRTMKAGGKRRVVVPPSLGFGESGAELGPNHALIPPFATLDFVVQIERVSIAPS